MKQLNFTHSLLIALLVLIASFAMGEAGNCYPSGKIKGKRPPYGQCNTENDSDCCKEGKPYNIYHCSPSKSNVILTLNGFENGEDGGGPSKCDNRYHNNNNLVVALSTGWFRFNNNKRCMNQIVINGNGRSVKAMVVDECDSTIGCDEEHAYQPPCPNNIVDASKAVWNALGVQESDDRYGYMQISWYDA